MCPGGNLPSGMYVGISCNASTKNLSDASLEQQYSCDFSLSKSISKHSDLAVCDCCHGNTDSGLLFYGIFYHVSVLLEKEFYADNSNWDGIVCCSTGFVCPGDRIYEMADRIFMVCVLGGMSDIVKLTLKTYRFIIFPGFILMRMKRFCRHFLRMRLNYILAKRRIQSSRE